MLATDVEIGASLWAKFMGLMGRDSLATGAGLWLPDSNGIHMMFVRFPIDAVFLGREAQGSRDGGSGGRGGGGGGGGGGIGTSSGGGGAGSGGGGGGTGSSGGGGGGSGGGSSSGGGAGARSGRHVVAVHRGLRAWTGLVPFVRGAHGVLELPVGTIDASQTQVGDLIEIA